MRTQFNLLAISYLQCYVMAKTFPAIPACIWTHWNQMKNNLWFKNRENNITLENRMTPCVWLLMWTFKVYGRRNFLPHSVHSCGLTSSWCFMWFFICGFVLKLWTGNQHRNNYIIITHFKRWITFYCILHTWIILHQRECLPNVPWGSLWTEISNRTDHKCNRTFLQSEKCEWVKRIQVNNLIYKPVCKTIWFRMPPFVVKCLPQISQVNLSLSIFFFLKCIIVMCTYSISLFAHICPHNSHLYSTLVCMLRCLFNSRESQ